MRNNVFFSISFQSLGARRQKLTLKTHFTTLNSSTRMTIDLYIYIFFFSFSWSPPHVPFIFLLPEPLCFKRTRVDTTFWDLDIWYSIERLSYGHTEQIRSVLLYNVFFCLLLFHFISLSLSLSSSVSLHFRD